MVTRTTSTSTETKAKRLVAIGDVATKVETPYGKKYAWAVNAVIELEDGRKVTYQLRGDTRAKLAEAIARGRERCADGITGMTLKSVSDTFGTNDYWVLNLFGGTWL